MQLFRMQKYLRTEWVMDNLQENSLLILFTYQINLNKHIFHNDTKYK